VKAIQRLWDRVISKDLGVTGKLDGLAIEYSQTAAGFPPLLLFALLVIYLILGILYESFVHPITVISGLPSACLGGLLILRFFSIELDLYGFLGLLLLLGIVKKNAIMVIDFAIEQVKTGASHREAITTACAARLRPILMTTLAAIVGALPVALGWGAGGESRQPMGLVVVGGLILSQLVTLYLTPAVYLCMSKLEPRTTKAAS
jgi:HAE1 family hydrophobic/amphiphilic exporter-1